MPIGIAAPPTGSAPPPGPATVAPKKKKPAIVGPPGSAVEAGDYSKANAGALADTQGIDSMVKEHFQGVLSGASKRFDDKTVSMMKQGLFETSKDQSSQSKRNLRSELAKSGTLRSGAYGRGVADIERSAASDYTKGVREIMLEKAKTEWEDKSKAIDQAQSWLKQKYDYDIGLKQIDATIKSAEIQAGATITAAGISAGATRDAARAGAGASRAAAQMNFDLGMAQLEESKRMNDARIGGLVG